MEAAQTSNWLLVAIAFIGLILTVVIPLIAYFNSNMNKNRQLISKHQTHVAETYATKDDVKQLGDRVERHVERQMTTGFDNLKELLKTLNLKTSI